MNIEEWLDEYGDPAINKMYNYETHKTHYMTTVVDWEKDDSNMFSLEIGKDSFGYFVEIDGNDVIQVDSVKFGEVNNFVEDLKQFLISVGYPEIEKFESPYCPVCSGCGEEGCCSPLNCEMSKDGMYCEGYLKDLKFGYRMQEELYEHVDSDVRDKIFNEVYEKFKMYKNDREETDNN